MTIAGWMDGLEKRDIALSITGDQIRYQSPRDALTEVDKHALRARRDEVITYLAARQAARNLRAAKGVSGALTPSVTQEMWRAWAGGAQEGVPFALNIAMVGTFRHDAASVTAAIHKVITRHDALRARFERQGPGLRAFLNPADSFVVEQQDLRSLSPDDAAAVADDEANAFRALLNPIEGQWLTRAKVFALPDNQSLAIISSSHMIVDGGTRNIVLDEIHDILDHGEAQATPSESYNDFSLAERMFLVGPEGKQLIDYWRRWYRDQPVMKAPSDGKVLMWGNGVRIVKIFRIPKRVLGKVRRLAEELSASPFLIYLTIFAITLSRWSGMECFPLRLLGDKRTSFELANTVGMMFCADAMEIHAPANQNFETIMRNIQIEYDSALSLRLPSLHYWAPHCVHPGIEAPDHPNKIPAAFNYYSVVTSRERAEAKTAPDTTAALPWPPDITTLPPQTWPRRSSPLFLHLSDEGSQASASLHFYQDVISPADQKLFIDLLFQVFSEVVPT